MLIDRRPTAYLLGQIAFAEGRDRARPYGDPALLQVIEEEGWTIAAALDLPAAWKSGWSAARRMQRQLRKEHRRWLKRTAMAKMKARGGIERSAKAKAAQGGQH